MEGKQCTQEERHAVTNQKKLRTRYTEKEKRHDEGKRKYGELQLDIFLKNNESNTKVKDEKDKIGKKKEREQHKRKKEKEEEN